MSGWVNGLMLGNLLTTHNPCQVGSITRSGLPTLRRVSELGRRIRAARAYKGIKSQRELGELLGGVPQSTMQRIESGERGLRPLEQITLLREIARVCELPYEWFTADLKRLPEISPKASGTSVIVVGDDDRTQTIEAPLTPEAVRAALESLLAQVDLAEVQGKSRTKRSPDDEDRPAESAGAGDA